MIPWDRTVEAMFADDQTYRDWLAVAVTALYSQVELGIIPPAGTEALEIWSNRGGFDALPENMSDQISALSLDRDPVEATIAWAGQWYGGAVKDWLGYGLTASNITDTGWALMFNRIHSRLADDRGPVHRLANALSEFGGDADDQDRLTSYVDRTRGPEPTTWANRVRKWATTIDVLTRQMDHAVVEPTTVNLSGPNGDYTGQFTTPTLEVTVAERLNLHARPFTASRQRTRIEWTPWLGGLASLTGSMAAIAEDLIEYETRQQVRLECDAPHARASIIAGAWDHARAQMTMHYSGLYRDVADGSHANMSTDVMVVAELCRSCWGTAAAVVPMIQTASTVATSTLAAEGEYTTKTREMEWGQADAD